MLFMRSYVLTDVLVESVREMAEALLITISTPPNCSTVFSIACHEEHSSASPPVSEPGQIPNAPPQSAPDA